MDRPWFIYTLSDPRTGQVRYVGWTFHVEKRLRSHICQSKRQNTHKSHWVNSLTAAGLRPTTAVVQEGVGPGWQKAEIHWIGHFRAVGADLTNGTSGGDGSPGRSPGPESRARMSAAHLGRRQSAESIAKMVSAQRGRPQSPEHVAKLAAVRAGKVPFAATTAAAVANRGRRIPDEVVARRSAARRGIPNAKVRKLTEDQVYEIRRSEGVESRASVARRYSLSPATVLAIWRRQTYGDLPVFAPDDAGMPLFAGRA